MQAVSLTAVTQLPDLATREVERPEPLEGQVVIQMIAAGVNPMDWESASGAHPWVETFPHTLGNEGTGTVVALGSKVQGFQLGDTVLAYNFGGSPGLFAQYAAVDPANLALLPADLDPVAWAGSPIGITSVFHAFYKRGLPPPGTRILIEGTGGVGLFAIQWAKKLGFDVAVLATARSQAWAKELGADHVLSADSAPEDLAAQLAELHPNGFDVIFSTLGQTSIPRLAGFLAKNGRFVSTMPLQSSPGREAADYALLNGASMSAVFRQNSWEWFLAEPSGTDLALMLSEARRLGITCPIACRFPLSQVSAAVTQAAKGGNRGKVLLVMT